MWYGLQRIKTVILLCVLTLWLIALPSLSSAQTNNKNTPDKAPVELDARTLFEVGSFGNFSAKERADQINEVLLDLVNSADVINLEVVEEGNEVAIRNKATASSPKGELQPARHILTLTKADVISEFNTSLQAQLWVDKLENAIKRGRTERSPKNLLKAALIAVGLVLGAIIIQVSLQSLRPLSLRQLDRVFHHNSVLDGWGELITQFLRLVFITLPLLLWSGVFFLVTNLFPQARGYRSRIFSILSSPIITLGNSSYSALGVLLLLGLTLGLWFAVKNLTKLIKSYVLSYTIADRGLQEVVAILTQYILTFLGVIVLWQIWGFDISALAIIASVLSVGIGFGLQNITNNFISGLILNLERPIKVGDLIDVGDLVGTVHRIGARSTEVVTLDRVSIVVPNSQLLENRVVNWNHNDPISRLRLSVGIAYGSDLRKVKAALLNAAKKHSDVLRTPRPQVWFQDFGDSSLKFELLVWIKDPRKQFRLKSDLNYLIESNLRRYGIEIPFPQRDLHLQSPYLEELFRSWLIAQGFNPPQARLSKDIALQSPSAKQVDPEELINSLEERLSNEEIKQIVASMRSSDGLDIRDRRYRLNFYRTCFVGSEAVDWLVRKQHFTREEALEFGQILMERGIIFHVTDEHSFRDEFLFYSFNKSY